MKKLMVRFTAVGILMIGTMLATPNLFANTYNLKGKWQISSPVLCNGEPQSLGVNSDDLRMSFRTDLLEMQVKSGTRWLFIFSKTKARRGSRISLLVSEESRSPGGVRLRKFSYYAKGKGKRFTMRIRRFSLTFGNRNRLSATATTRFQTYKPRDAAPNWISCSFEYERVPN